MEKFYLEEPSMNRKKEAIEYIEEHITAKSNINGSGGLDSNYKNYEHWLEMLELMKDPKTVPTDRCPGFTYFLIRKSDNRIIGMINIRYNLSEFMLKHGGHIGYGIRPSERNKGYNKINLYLGLEKCDTLGLDRVLLIASDGNPGSYKTILALGGILESKILDDKNKNIMMGRYWINVKKSLKDYHKKYSQYEKSL